MLNLVEDGDLIQERRRVIEDFGQFFAGWGLAPTQGRIWGYLLLCAEPTSLDLIARDLGISKSNASTATRQLEQFLLVRRSGQPGTRRALYEANAMSRRFFDQITAAYGGLARILESGMRVAPDPLVRNRLEEASRFFRSWTQELDALVSRLGYTRG